MLRAAAFFYGDAWWPLRISPIGWRWGKGTMSGMRLIDHPMPFEAQPITMNRASTPLCLNGLQPLALACAILALTGCTTLKNAGGGGPAGGQASGQSAAPASGATAGATPGSAQAASTAPSAPAFDVVIKGADRLDGWLPIWRRQEKVWIELAADDFGRPMFLSPKLLSGVGEGGFFGGLLASRSALVGRPQWVEFRRVHQQVQLVAINAAFRANKDMPQSLAVQAAFSPSLLASGAVASSPHPQRNTVLVEVSNLLTGDLLGLAMQLNQTFKQGYGLDGRNTTITQARASATGLQFEVQQHFATGSITTGGQPGSSATVPSALPDPRSLFLSVQYTLSPLPASMAPTRPADARVGYFTSTVADFSNDLTRSPRQRFINRWRLDKKEPKAALSPPVRPLIYWLDKSIPKEYRPTIREGVLAWNTAFEAIGIQGAIEVKDATDTEPKDIVGNGQAIVRWMSNHRPSFGAIGPSHVDPRSGEILTADIGLEGLSSRAIRATRSQVLGTSAATSATEHSADDIRTQGDRCEHSELAAEQLGYALDVLAAQRELPPDSEEVKAFVLAYLKDTTMHEVGHTLGLRHNFRGSRWRPNADLDRLDITTKYGISASVMDYSPINLNLPGQPAGAPFQTTLGPYDLWAIEYGYKSLEGDATVQQEALRQIAQRSADPAWQYALDYGTDEDNALGLDPQSLVFDQGRDPIAFAQRRIALARDLIERQAAVVLKPTDEPQIQRRRIAYALRDLERTANVLTRQVGGIVTRRDAPGSGRDLLDPLPAQTQREALALLSEQFLSTRALGIPPKLQRNLAPDYFERIEAFQDPSTPAPLTDFSVSDQLVQLQRQVLNALMNDALAERLLDNIDKTRDRETRPLTLRELHRTLREAIWSAPTKAPRKGASDDNAPWQRNVQREYINRLSISLLRGGNRADVRAQVRHQAQLLLAQLQKPVSKDADSTAEAHRRDCLETLQRALSASVQRTTP
jgi:predicted transcriptional regulator